jgi:hypothetical protein
VDGRIRIPAARGIHGEKFLLLYKSYTRVSVTIYPMGLSLGTKVRERERDCEYTKE